VDKPTWIVFEGIDGSGKTTQAKRLNEYLNNHGMKSLYKHVFDTRAGRLLREMFIDNTFSNTVEILILCAARQAFLDEIVAEEDEYDVLIIDRFFLSILAMQGNNKEDIGFINYIREKICGGGREHIVFHMRTPPEVCKSRLKNRIVPDRIEEKGVEFHRLVFDRYMTLLRKEEDVHHIDGRGDIEDIHKSIVDKTLLLLSASDGGRE
jgi:dTMP kinase